MMLLPMLNGGSVANEWQPISAVMCRSSTSFCRIFVGAKEGRCGHPVHNGEGRGGTSAASLAAATGETSVLRVATAPPPVRSSGAHLSMNSPNPTRSTSTVYSPNIGNGPLPTMRALTSCWRRIWHAACSIYSGWPSSTISTARLPLQNLTHSSDTSGYVTLSTYSGTLLLPNASAQSSSSSALSALL